MDIQGTIAEQRQRIRVKRGPGKGLLDWIKLCRSFKQQNSAERVVVTFEELRKYNVEDDCWTAFRGNTAYSKSVSQCYDNEKYPPLSQIPA